MRKAARMPTLVGIAWLALGLTSSALAQDADANIDFRNQSAGVAVLREGKISTTNESDQWKTSEYFLHLDAGASVRIDLESTDFDPALRIFEKRGNRRFLVAENDDFGDTLNSRIRFSSPAGGEFQVEVGPSELAVELSADHTHFRLIVSKETRPPPPRPDPLAFDQRINVEFAGLNVPLQTQDDWDESRFARRYAFTAIKGQRVAFWIDAPTADKIATGQMPSLQLRRAGEPGFPISLPNRRRLNGGIRAMTIIPEDGDYVLFVIPERFTETPFVLEANLKTISPTSAESLEFGKKVDRSFSLADSETTGNLGERSGILYHEWILSVRQGQQIRVEMCSAEAVDSFIQLVGATAIGERKLKEADDIEEGETTSCDRTSRNAALELTVTQKGTLRFFVSPLKDPGAYSLIAIERNASRAPRTPRN